MAAAVMRVTIILVTLVWDCPWARSQTTGELCDLDLWYMDMAAEGAFDGELSQQQHTVKQRIETLIARHRQRADGAGISCSTLSTFKNILLHGRTNGQAQARRPTDPGTDPRDNDRALHASEAAPNLKPISERRERVDSSGHPTPGVERERRDSKQKQRNDEFSPLGWTSQNTSQSECSVYEYLFPTPKPPPSNTNPGRMKSANSYFWRLCICLRKGMDRQKYAERNFSFCRYHLLMRGRSGKSSQERLNETKTKSKQDTQSGPKAANFWLLCSCPRRDEYRRQHARINSSLCQYYLLTQGLSGNDSERRPNVTSLKLKQRSRTPVTSCDRPGVCSYMCFIFIAPRKCLLHYPHSDSTPRTDGLSRQHQTKPFEKEESRKVTTASFTATSKDTLSSSDTASFSVSSSDVASHEKESSTDGYIPGVTRTVKDTIPPGGEQSPKDMIASGDTGVPLQRASSGDSDKSNHAWSSDQLATTGDKISNHSADQLATTGDKISNHSADQLATTGDKISNHSADQLATTGDKISNHSADQLATTGDKISNHSAGVNTSVRILPFLTRTESGQTDCVANNFYTFEVWKAIQRKASWRSGSKEDQREIKHATKRFVHKGDPGSNSESSQKLQDNESRKKTNEPTEKETSSRTEQVTGHKSLDHVGKYNSEDDPLPEDGNLNRKTTVRQDFVKPEDKDKKQQDENPESDTNEDDRPSKSEVGRLEQLLRRQSLEQTSKIQSLEMMIMKLEKQQMSQTVDEQRELTRLLRLENQILQVENELLRLNQSHALLREENEKLKARQSQYPALEHKAGQEGRWPGRSDLAMSSGGNTHVQMLSAQQKKVDRLDKLLRSQTAALERLQSQLQKLEGRNNALEEMMVKQASILSHAMVKLQELTEENLKSRHEARETGAMLDLPVSSLRVLEKIENILQTRLYVGHGGQVSSLTSVQEGVATQSYTPGVGQRMLDVLQSTPSRFVTGAESRLRKCDGSRGQKVCLYYVVLISRCPPFRAVSWGRCPYLVGEFSPGESKITTAKTDSGRDEGGAFRRVFSDNSNTGTRVIDMIRQHDKTPDSWEGPSTTHAAHPNAGPGGKSEASVSLGGHAGASWGASDNDKVSKDGGSSGGKATAGERSESRGAGNDEVSGAERKKPDLPPTTSVQKTHLLNKRTDPPRDITPERGAGHGPNPTAQGADVVDIPEIQTPALRAESGSSARNPEYSSSSHDKQGRDRVMPEPVSVFDSAVQEGVETVTKEDTHSAETSEGQPSHSKPDSLSSKISHASTAGTPSANLDTATANQDRERKERTNHVSDKTGKVRDETVHREVPLQDSVSMATERAAEEARKKAEQELEAELMVKKLQAAERRVVLYPPLDDRKPKDCYDILLKSGSQARNGPQKVFVSGLRLYVTVYCDMKGGGWTVLLKREDGSVDFYRDWQEYKEGFGGPFSEHYVGNDVVHYLTNQGHYSLQVDLKDWEGETRVAKYKHFWVEDEGQGFRLHVLGYSGTARDGLGKHDGMRFSTKDVDNDLLVKEMGGSCARRFQGAGWYYKCYASNLLGQHYVDGVVPHGKFDGVAWKPWKGPSYSLKEVVMKIRPSNVP